MQFKLIAFKLGRVGATPGAMAALEQAGASPDYYLDAHLQGAPGVLCADDIEANLRAREDGTRIISCFRIPTGRRVYVITEADRSCTTILLPEEY